MIEESEKLEEEDDDDMSRFEIIDASDNSFEQDIEEEIDEVLVIDENDDGISFIDAQDDDNDDSSTAEIPIFKQRKTDL